MLSSDPYAPPHVTDLTAAVPPPDEKRPNLPLKLLFQSVLFFIRGFIAGFCTLIFLVHSSRTSVLWENVIPMLSVLAVLGAATHWLDYRLAERWRLGRLAMIAYLIGAVVTACAGLLGWFPTPY